MLADPTMQGCKASVFDTSVFGMTPPLGGQPRMQRGGPGNVLDEVMEVELQPDLNLVSAAPGQIRRLRLYLDPDLGSMTWWRLWATCKT